jgi:excisionase family DNA binding protein
MTDEPEDIPVPSPENPFRSPSYIAEAMDVQPYTVREWLRSGKLKGYQVGGQWKVLQSDFVAYLQKEFGPSGSR